MVLELYVTSFFNMKSWRVKFKNFLGDFPVHYAALFIDRTINNNYMALLMALHHAHDGFLRCFKSNIHFWYHSNFESTSVFADVILVSDYHSYKEKRTKLLL